MGGYSEPAGTASHAAPRMIQVAPIIDPDTGGVALYGVDDLGRIWWRTVSKPKIDDPPAKDVDPWTLVPGPRAIAAARTVDVDATLPNDTRPSAPPVIAGPSPTIIVDASLSPTVPAVHVRVWNRDRTDWDCRPECWCRQ